jgi:hypothetical protein
MTPAIEESIAAASSAASVRGYNITPRMISSAILK